MEGASPSPFLSFPPPWTKVTCGSFSEHSCLCKKVLEIPVIVKRKTKDLIIYYFSHRTGTTQWVDPRMAQVKKATVDDCDEDGTLSVFLGM